MKTVTFKKVIHYELSANNEHINYGGCELVLTTQGKGQVKIILNPPLPRKKNLSKNKDKL